MNALQMLLDDPFLPAREAATELGMLSRGDLAEMDDEDLAYLWHNQASVTRPMFELIPDAVDCYDATLQGCVLCGSALLRIPASHT